MLFTRMAVRLIQPLVDRPIAEGFDDLERLHQKHWESDGTRLVELLDATAHLVAGLAREQSQVRIPHRRELDGGERRIAARDVQVCHSGQSIVNPDPVPISASAERSANGSEHRFLLIAANDEIRVFGKTPAVAEPAKAAVRQEAAQTDRTSIERRDPGEAAALIARHQD